MYQDLSNKYFVPLPNKQAIRASLDSIKSQIEELESIMPQELDEIENSKINTENLMFYRFRN